MAVGNQLGGQLADRYRYRGLVVGYVGALGFCVVIAVDGENFGVLMVCLCGVSAFPSLMPICCACA
jgi:predicted MFS family arabinose efflux permease